jgi:WD40 repeat protein
MSRLATLKLDGDLEQGVKAVLTISTLHPLKETAAQELQAEHPASSAEVSGTLPPNPGLTNAVGQWQSSCRSLAAAIGQWQSSYQSPPATRMQVNQVTYDASIHKCRSTCRELDQKLRSQLNTWLLSDSFRPIRDKWLKELMHDEVRVLVRASNQSLLKLPWQLWTLIEQNSLAEVAFGSLDTEFNSKAQMPTLRGRVKILAILGNSEGIDVEGDRRLLESFPDSNLTFLVEPKRQDINDQLWDQDWDILYFAGHSDTKRDQGIIKINKTESLTIEDLRYALRNSVDRGLQLAIFNSCAGMGLAFELQQLHFPQVIVMREPVNDQIAQEFLRHFLPEYIGGKSLYLAEREARLRLHGRENEFPGASWLPVIFQSPATVPPTWQDLGRRPTTLCPYRGLLVFREEDALFFYGRDSFTKTLVDATQRGEVVSVIGASGSGKSSIVFAGLVPALRQQGAWEIVAFRPGQRPFQAIATAWVMLRASDQAQPEQLQSVLQLAEAWRTDEAALYTAIEDAVWESPGTKVLLIVDQFEELYTQCQDVQERQAFIDGLLKVVELPNVALVLTLRTDFLGQALAYSPLADVLQRGNRMLGAMSRAELQAAIAQPAALLGVTLEEGLTDRMIEAVSRSEGNLPLLEFALQELWEKRQGTQLIHAAYDEIGGLERAVARHMEQAYGGLSESEKERARRIFLQLIRPGEGSVDTRRVATHAEIGDENWELVTRLASERLVVTGQDEIAKTETVELVHEALIYEWQRLGNWIDENRDFRLWQERLRAAVQQWETSERDAGALLRGKPLIDAEDWLLKRPEELTAEKEFITASVRLRDQETEKLSRQRRRTVIGLTSGLAGALGLAAIAGVGWWLATNAATNERIKTLTLESQSLFTLAKGDSRYPIDSLSSSPEDRGTDQEEDQLFQDSIIKAVEAGQELKHAVGVKPEIRFQVLGMLQRIVNTRERPKPFFLSECESRKRGFVSFASTSDRQTIACVNYDGTVRLWDGSTGKKVNIFRGDSEWVDGVAFSPEGKIIASGSADGTVNLWAQTTGKKTRALKGHLSQVRSIVFSPNGQILAVANYDNTIDFWNLLTGEKLRTLNTHIDNFPIKTLQFSPNGKFFASLIGDQTLKLWDLSTGKELKTIRSLDSSIPRINFSFSSDSQTITYSDGNSPRDARVRLWSISGKRELRNIPVFGKPFFSPNRRIIAVIDAEEDEPDVRKWDYTSSKGSVSLWDAFTGKKLKTFNDFSYGELSDIGFSSDGQWIAIEEYDNKGGSNLGPVVGSKSQITLIREDGSKRKAIKQLGEIFDIAFSPNGKKLAISSLGGKEGWYIISKLWNPATGKELKTLIDEPIKFDPGGLSVGLGVLFSPDGRMIAAVNSSGIIKFFDSRTGKERNSPNISPSKDLKPIISKDGTAIITPKTDGSLVAKDRSTGEEVRMNRYDSTLVNTAHISDDNQIITTVDWRGKLQQRELKTGRALKTINLSFDRYASSLKFSPDGRRVAGAMSNYVVKVWDVATGKEIATLKEYIKVKDELNDWRRNEVFFKSNGQVVALLREDSKDPYENGGELELWEVSTRKPIQLSKEMDTGVTSISFSPTSDDLAILKSDNIVRLWNLSSRQLKKTIKPVLAEVRSIQFENDGKLIFAKGSNELKVLNASKNQEIASFKLPTFASLSSYFNFSADGKKLILRDDFTFAFLDLDLDSLMRRSCDVFHEYQKSDQTASKNRKNICDSVLSAEG